MRVPRPAASPVIFALAVLAACSEPTATFMAPSAESNASIDLAGGAAQNRLLATIRGATARYHRVEVALADGYTFIAACHYSAAGGKGYHYRKPALTDGVLDPAQPEILLYEPQENGKLKLTGVAFLILSNAWDATHDEPPMLGDQPFIDRRAPGSLGPPFPNYALFVAVWRHNPAGMYAQYNPTVSCEFASASVLE